MVKRVLHVLTMIFSALSALFPRPEGLHHARFALPHELSILMTHVLDETGLLLGVSHWGGLYRVRGSRARRELGNVLVVAPTRAGKGLLAVSQLLTWPHSVVVNDLKGELYEQTAGYRQSLGPVYRLDPRGLGHQYDPLQGKLDEDELYALAKHLLYEAREGDGLAFTQRATKMLTLLFLSARALNHLMGQEAYHLLPFVGKMADMGLNSAASAVNAISPDLARRLLDDVYQPDKDYTDNRYLASSWESLTARLYPLLTEKVVRTFAGADFTGRQIITATKPVTVYLSWPEQALLAKTALMRLVWESLIGEMLETFDSLQGRSCQPVLLLLDEAGALHIPSLPQYVATVAGRGLSIWAAYQDNAQIDNLYGKYKADTIRNNMDSKVFYRQASEQTARDIERSLGYRSGYAHSHTMRGGAESSESLGETAVPLLTARDINELALDEVIAFFSNRKPFRARRMDWRAFPELVRRRGLSPPAVHPLPAVPELLLPSQRGPLGRWPMTAIDPDAIN